MALRQKFLRLLALQYFLVGIKKRFSVEHPFINNMALIISNCAA
jgi:hypothetical protein